MVRAAGYDYRKYRVGPKRAYGSGRFPSANLAKLPSPALRREPFLDRCSDRHLRRSYPIRNWETSMAVATERRNRSHLVRSTPDPNHHLQLMTRIEPARQRPDERSFRPHVKIKKPPT